MFRFCIISLVLTAGVVAPRGDRGLIHEIYGDHWVMWNGEKPDSDYLYLFMPGSGQLPEIRSEWVLESAAEVGLHRLR